ncbi:hypothetical protein ACHAQA_005943 [Verticillium albo-atrum]
MDDVNLDDFVLDNETYWPPMPCAHCKRHRLQCFILRTTAANPNPVSSCSSCVALFRDCTLAGQGKRGHSSFETSEPVIGHLHGVSEEYSTATATPFLDGPPFPGDGDFASGDFAFGEAAAPFTPTAPTPSSSSILPAASSKRASSRSVHKNRALRNWFAANMDHPYPSDEIKDSLAQQSGLSKSQVVNWFTNARRRHRLSLRASKQSSSQHHPQGSPRPRSLISSASSSKNLTPLERWRNSPPDDEPVDPAAIERALEAFMSDNSNDFEPVSAGGDHFDGSASSASGDFNFNAPASSGSNSSAYSFHSAMSSSFMARSAQSSDGGGSTTNKNSRSSRAAGAPLFQCTFCLQTFRKKFDWSRHEQSVHLPGLHSWVCGVPLGADAPLVLWRAGQQQTAPECVFCGRAAPDVSHFQSHQFEECAERAPAARTFSRKDHLVQHLHKFHGCRRREGWAMDVSMLRHTQDAVPSRCGFCGVRMGGWEQRVQHLAAHFRAGLTMERWEGGCGIEGGMAAMVQGVLHDGGGDGGDSTDSPLFTFDMTEVDLGGNTQGQL